MLVLVRFGLLVFVCLDWLSFVFRLVLFCVEHGFIVLLFNDLVCVLVGRVGLGLIYVVLFWCLHLKLC